MRILIVDDHPKVSRALQSALEYAHAGEVIGVARSVRGCFELAVRADVIVLDLMLPDYSGLDAVRRLRERIPQIPIIAYSATTEDEIIEAVKPHVEAFVRKGLVDPLVDALGRVRQHLYNGVGANG